MAGDGQPEPAAGAAQDGDQDQGPQLNPVEQALMAARERMADGGSMTPAAEPEGEPSGEDPDATAQAGDGEGEAATAEGEGEPTGDPDEGEQAEQDDGEVAGGAEGETGTEGDGEGTGDGEVDPDLVVSIPARREGDPEHEIVVEDTDTAERLRQLTNSAMRGDAVRAERARIDQEQEQIEEMETAIATDPAGFILSNVPEDVQEVVAMSLITQPAIWGRVQEQLDELSDPDKLRLVQAELKTKRLEAQNTLRDRAKDRREAKQQAKQVIDGIHQMVPVTDGITESRRDTIIASVQQTVAAAIQASGKTTVDIQDLPLLAATALRQHGIDPIAAAAALQKGESAESEPGAKPPAKKKQRTVAQLKTASEQRKKAAAGTPPGSGAPAAAPKLPTGQNIEERMKLVREKGIGNLMGGK